jgi:hypothetical protein
MRTRFLLAAAALAAAACDGDGPTGSNGGNGVPESQLTFLAPRPGGPALATTTASVLAVKGEDAELEIEYVTGEDFLRFRLDDESLLRRPDGTPILDGESVLITATVVDASRLIVEFQPAGLVFDPSEPAELRLRYAESDDDLDDDGDVDDDDESIETEFAIWRQETVGANWEQVGSAVFKDLEEVEADLTGFTRYAISYRR